MRRFLLLAGVLLMLTGCVSSGEDDLREWMAEQRQQTKPFVKPIPAPKNYKPVAYSQADATDPYDDRKLALAVKGDTRREGNSALIAAERARRKEALEAYPLDTMAMVGSLMKREGTVALVTVGGLLHQVHVGNYLGQNYGRVVRITETELTLREVVQDATGDWVARSTALQLQERLK